jgi:hypothetical protein
MLGQQSTDLIDQGSMTLDQQCPHSMKRLHFLLCGTLDCNEAHGRAGDRLADGLGVARVVLVGLRVGFTSCGAINLTSCPSFAISRAQ